MQRRDALKYGLSAAALAAGGLRAFGAPRELKGAAIPRVTIAPIDIELAPGVIVRSIAFDSRAPGSPINRSDLQTGCEVHNASDYPLVVHSPAFTEPLIRLPPGGCARAILRTAEQAPSFASIKPYHAYCSAKGAMATGTLMNVNERDDGIGAFDQLQVLSINRWRPRFEPTVGHDYASFNDKLLWASEPIKVRPGDRVRFHFSNTSATQEITLALPQHRFLIVALDGYQVPTPHLVDRIQVGPAESVDAIVTMDRRGRWILGSTQRNDRAAGIGRLVEYAGAAGAPVDGDYGVADWDYGRFGAETPAVHTPVRLAAPPLSLRGVRLRSPNDPRLVDPTPLATALPFRASQGERHRLVATNVTRDPQTLRLLDHTVELVSVAGRQIAGLRKDVVTLPSFTRIEIEFAARAEKVYLAHARHVTLDPTADGSC